MSSLSLQTRFRLNLSASRVVVLFGLLLMKFATSAPTFAAITVSPSPDHSSTTTAAAAVDRLILLYEDIELRGIRSRLHVGLSTCVNLIGKLNDFFSSVDTMGGCFLLCEHQNCRGKCQRVTGKVKNLSRFGLNDRVSSLRTCSDDGHNNEESKSKNINTRKRHAANDSNNVGVRRSTSSTSVFLRRRIRRSVRLKAEEKEKSSVSSLFSSSLPPRRIKRRTGTEDSHHHHHPKSSDHSRTVMSSYSLRTPSFINRNGTVIPKSIISVVPRTESNNSYQRLLRIPRHRRKRKGLLVRK